MRPSGTAWWRHTAGWRLAGASLALKLTLFLLTPYAMQPDSAGHLLNAAALRDGRWGDIHLSFPLGYSALVAGVAGWVGDPELAGNAVSLVLSALLAVPVYGLGVAILGARAASLGTALVVCFPLLNVYAPMVLSDSAYLTVLAAAVATGWAALASGTTAVGAAAGIMFGAAYLVREEGIGYGAAFALLWAARQWRAADRLGGVLRTLAYLGGWAALVLPYVWFLHWRTGGAWVLTSQMGNVAVDVAAGQALTDLRAAPGFAYAFLLQHSEAFLMKYLGNWEQMLASAIPQLVPVPLLGLAAIGVAGRAGGERLTGRLYLLAMLLPPMFLIPVSHIIARYFLCLVPWLLLFAADGVLICQERLTGAAARSWARGAAAALAAAVVVPVLAGLVLIPLRPRLGLLPLYEIEYKRAGQWMQVHLPASARVLTSVGGIDYYAQRPRVLVRPPGSRTVHDTLSLDDILTLAADGEAPCYLVVQERWPQKTLLPLLDETHAPEALRPVYVDTTYLGAKVVVYEVRGRRPG